ncbi:kinase-like domain-containing protein, partial [Globomyces pollinis-pini]
YFKVLESSDFKNDILNEGYYDRFFVEMKKLGRGQRGSVFLCRHILDGIELGMFAVKAIPVGTSHTWLSRMLKEVTLLGNLKHPNIIEYKHAWLENRKLSLFGPEVPCLFILMELANGGNVEELIQIHDLKSDPNTFTPNPFASPAEQLKQKKEWKRRMAKQPASEIVPWIPTSLSMKESIRNDLNVDGGYGIVNNVKVRFLNHYFIKNLFLDICHGLAHLHANGIIHRDLKPPNLLLRYPDELKTGNPLLIYTRNVKPRVLISDFGECELISDEISRVRTGATGTMEFMPPELLIKDSNGVYIPNHSRSADIWSLGVVLYYLCYSTVPYSQIDDVDILKEEIISFNSENLQFPNTPRVSTMFNDIIRSLLSTDANNRPSINQVIDIVSSLPDNLDKLSQDCDKDQNISNEVKNVDILQQQSLSSNVGINMTTFIQDIMSDNFRLMFAGFCCVVQVAVISIPCHPYSPKPLPLLLISMITMTSILSITQTVIPKLVFGSLICVFISGILMDGVCQNK